MRTLRNILILSVFLLGSVQMAAQPADSARLGFLVRGRVSDARSGRPMEAVHVSTPGRHHATVTNADGSFVLKSDREIRTVVFSSLGYRTLRLPVESPAPLEVKLVPEPLSLPEAVIVSGNPREIVEMAVDRIWDTYCTEPELLECFDRETVQKRQRFTYVAEAVARIYKSVYDGGALYRDAAALEKSRVLVSQRRRDTLSVKTQGGPTLAVVMDVVKNGDVLLSRDELKHYRFEMGQPVYIGDRIQFVIHLHPLEFVDYALYNGTLYIDRETLAFTRVELSLDVSDPGRATRMILVRKPASLRFVPEEVSYVVNYRQVNGKARLEYLRSTMRFACDWKKRLFKTHYTAVNELVVTDVREPAVPIPRQERFLSREILEDKAAEFLDPDFWEDYNIIEPTESLEHAIDRLRKGR